MLQQRYLPKVTPKVIEELEAAKIDATKELILGGVDWLEMKIVLLQNFLVR